jgi:hypothetical protein
MEIPRYGLSFIMYQAEGAALSGAAYIETVWSNYSGTAYIAGYDNNTTAVTTFTVYAPTTGSYPITLHYSAGNGTDSTIGLTVNGSSLGNITCTGTADWNTWADVVSTVTLNAGSNTIAYSAASSVATGIHLDYIEVPLACRYEAENATLSGGAGINTNHLGYSGTGFVDGFYNSSTATVTFTITVAAAGVYALTLRYATGGGTSTNTNLVVNTINLGAITCYAQSSWDIWDNYVQNISLFAGTNVITFTPAASSTANINLDYITVQQVLPYRTPVYGYFAGGWSTAPTAATYRIVFSTGTTSANTVSNLSSTRWGLAETSVSDGFSCGYFAGGFSATWMTTTDRIIFSTGVTSANTVSNISTTRRKLAGISDGAMYGYFAGGETATNTEVVTSDRIVFSTGVTSANTVSNLSSARCYVTGVSDGTLYGYFAGGDTTGSSALVTTTDRITFSSGTTSLNTVSNLSQARADTASISDAVTYGYWMGGYLTLGSSYVATTDRIVFSTGVTSAATTSNLTFAKDAAASAGDGLTYGYIAGGHTGSSVSIINTDRITFSSGTTAANTTSNLTVATADITGLSEGAV